MADYRGSKGGAYNTTYSGPTPVELFDAGDWIGCVHACAFVLFAMGDAGRALAALDDESYFHELIHRAAGVEACTANRHQPEIIRAEVVLLWDDFCAAMRS